MSKNKSVLYSILTISSLGIVAKILGLLREGVVAAYFGTSAQMDVFSMLSSLMTTVITIVAASASLSYLPIFVTNNEKYGIDEAAKRLSNILNQYLVLSTFFYFLLYILSPLMPIILKDRVTGVDNETIVLYTRLLFSTVIASGFSRLQLSALGGLYDYGWLQKTTALYSIISIVLTVALGRKYGIGVLVASYILNSIIQLVILQLVLRKHGCKYSFYLKFNDKETLAVWKTLIPVFLGSEIYLLGLTIDRTLALSTGIEGVASAFNYAGLLYGLVNTIISAPIITVFYTELSKKYAIVGLDGLYENLNRTITKIAIILLPVALFLCVDSNEFVTCVLKRGAFDEHSVEIVAPIFTIYILIAPFYALRAILARVYIIINEQKSPMISGIIFIILNIGLGYLLCKLFGAWGIALGAMAAMVVSSVYLYIILKRRYSYDGNLLNKSVLWSLAASIISDAAVALSLCYANISSSYVGFIIHGLLFVLVYIFVLRLANIPEYLTLERKCINIISKLKN